jgi:hypothetical protein
MLTNFVSQLITGERPLPFTRPAKTGLTSDSTISFFLDSFSIKGPDKSIDNFRVQAKDAWLHSQTSCGRPRSQELFFVVHGFEKLFLQFGELFVHLFELGIDSRWLDNHSEPLSKSGLVWMNRKIHPIRVMKAYKRKLGARANTNFLFLKKISNKKNCPLLVSRCQSFSFQMA